MKITEQFQTKHVIITFLLAYKTTHVVKSKDVPSCQITTKLKHAQVKFRFQELKNELSIVSKLGNKSLLEQYKMSYERCIL